MSDYKWTDDLFTYPNVKMDTGSMDYVVEEYNVDAIDLESEERCPCWPYDEVSEMVRDKMDEELMEMARDANDHQVGGNHYTDLPMQPLELTQAMYGDEGLEASLFTKVLKYVMRRKEGVDRVEDIDKAIDCLYKMRDIYTKKEIPF